MIINLENCERTGCENQVETVTSMPLNMGGVMVLAEVRLCGPCNIERLTINGIATGRLK